MNVETEIEEEAKVEEEIQASAQAFMEINIKVVVMKDLVQPKKPTRFK